MQLYALDSSNELIYIASASKQCDYFCIECQARLRKREGPSLHSHFYHIERPKNCKQSGKSETHLALQLHLKSLIPEAVLEKRMALIQRIADVCWEEKKIIFEIQCSFISSQEVIQRNKDYASCGYHVVWILHDTLFNQRFQKDAEKVLMHTSFYYTNFNEKEEGIIYDQWDYFKNNLRQTLVRSHSVSLEKLTSVLQVEKAPKMIQKRLNDWPFCFQDDLIFQACIEKNQDLLKLLKSSSQEPKMIFLLSILLRKAKQFIKTIFYAIIEASCQ